MTTCHLGASLVLETIILLWSSQEKLSRWEIHSSELRTNNLWPKNGFCRQSIVVFRKLYCLKRCRLIIQDWLISQQGYGFHRWMILGYSGCAEPLVQIIEFHVLEPNLLNISQHCCSDQKSSQRSLCAHSTERILIFNHFLQRNNMLQKTIIC